MKSKSGKLSDLIHLEMGQSPKGDSYNHSSKGIPLLNGPSEFGIKHPTPKTWTTQPTKISKNTDLIFCVRGSTTGRMNWCDQEYCLGRGVCSIRGKFYEFDTKFVYYLITLHLDKLLRIANGSVFPNLSGSDILNFEIIYPEKNERKKIADFLYDLDTKIQNLQNQNHILEQTAQAIFKSWFVDFDGVTEFEDSELGKIPKGWMVESIGFLFTITDYTANGSFAGLRENVTYSYVPDYAILIRQLDHNRNWNGDYVYVDKHSYDFLKKSSLVPGDVMISNIGNVGTVFRVPDLGKPMTGAPNILVVKTVDSKKEFIYNLLRNPIGQNAIFSITTGSAQPKFNKTDFRNLKIISPAENIIKQFHDVSYPLRRKIEINSFKIQSLTKTRDTLLPKLMSGEIRV